MPNAVRVGNRLSGWGCGLGKLKTPRLLLLSGLHLLIIMNHWSDGLSEVIVGDDHNELRRSWTQG